MRERCLTEPVSEGEDGTDDSQRTACAHNYEVLAGKSLRVGVPMMRLPHTFKRDKTTKEMIGSDFDDPANVAMYGPAR